jgi:hypothetical protein
VLGEEFIDGYWVRCPWCEHQMPSNDIDGAYEEDEHHTYCDDCGLLFRFVTRVSYSFTSPGVAVEEEGE